MLFLLLFVCCVRLTSQVDMMPTKSIDELHSHFEVNKESIQNLGQILDKMKRISYNQQLSKQGLHDVSLYSNKLIHKFLI
jgi:hypothetical protein